MGVCVYSYTAYVYLCMFVCACVFVCRSCRKESFIPFNFLFFSFGWIISSDLFMSSLIVFLLD